MKTFLTILSIITVAGSTSAFASLRYYPKQGVYVIQQQRPRDKDNLKGIGLTYSGTVQKTKDKDGQDIYQVYSRNCGRVTLPTDGKKAPREGQSVKYRFQSSGSCDVKDWE